MSKSVTRRFEATVQPVPGRSPLFIEVPFDPRKVFGKVRAQVTVIVNGFAFQTRLAPMSGKVVVGFNRENRASTGVEAGDRVDVTISLDTAERKIEPPRDLVNALKRSKGAWAGWQKLSYTHQKEHVRAIEEAKNPETRRRRIARTVAMLAPE